MKIYIINQFDHTYKDNGIDREIYTYLKTIETLSDALQYTYDEAMDNVKAFYNVTIPKIIPKLEVTCDDDFRTIYIISYKYNDIEVDKYKIIEEEIIIPYKYNNIEVDKCKTIEEEEEIDIIEEKDIEKQMNDKHKSSLEFIYSLPKCDICGGDFAYRPIIDKDTGKKQIICTACHMKMTFANGFRKYSSVEEPKKEII